MKIDKDPGINYFKASNEWLEKFCLQNNIVFWTVCLESSDCPIDISESGKKSLEYFLSKYEVKNVF